jgi:hypothetical protein
LAEVIGAAKGKHHHNWDEKTLNRRADDFIRAQPPGYGILLKRVAHKEHGIAHSADTTMPALTQPLSLIALVLPASRLYRGAARAIGSGRATRTALGSSHRLVETDVADFDGFWQCQFLEQRRLERLQHFQQPHVTAQDSHEHQPMDFRSCAPPGLVLATSNGSKFPVL